MEDVNIDTQAPSKTSVIVFRLLFLIAVISFAITFYRSYMPEIKAISQSKAQYVQSLILSKSISGAGSDQAYYLQVANAFKGQPSDMEVDAQRFAQTKVGSTVCIKTAEMQQPEFAQPADCEAQK